MYQDDKKIQLLESVAHIRNGFVFPNWWEYLLRNGADAFEVLPIPNKKTEGWRETNLMPFFSPQRKWTLRVHKKVQEENIPKNIYDIFPPTAIWENGAIKSRTYNSPTLFINSFKDSILRGYGNIIQQIFEKEKDPQHIFEALSDMFMHNGIFLYIPKETVVEKPIHITIMSRGFDADTVDVPRVLVYLDDNAQATVTVHYGADTQEPHSVWVNAREQIIVGRNAHLKYLNSIQGTNDTLRFFSTSVQLGCESSFSYNSLHLSGQFIRSEIDVEIEGENVTSQINGLVINKGRCFSETQQLIQHLKGYGTSRIHWRGLGQEQSKTVYRGKIYIAPDAQKSDSIQQFKGLSLSDEAVINAKPQLEIYADDVRCTHGATVGPPPPDLIYYFQTRGIKPDKARSLLIRGFINQILKEFPIREVEDFVNICISKEVKE